MTSLSRVRLISTRWTVAYQAPPSMGFFRQEYWSGLPFPSPGIFPTQGSNLGLSLNPGLPRCRQTLYPLSHQGSPSEYTRALPFGPPSHPGPRSAESRNLIVYCKVSIVTDFIHSINSAYVSVLISQFLPPLSLHI